MWGWPIVEPSTALTWNWHHQIICDEFQAQLEGGRFGRPWFQNLIFNVPPGSMKIPYRECVRARVEVDLGSFVARDLRLREPECGAAR